MKSDSPFLLENASWPALLVDGASTICRANQAAVRLLGPAVSGNSAQLAAIWAPDSAQTPIQFLSHWERSPSATTSIKLRGKGGSSGSFLASICSLSLEDKKYFLLQFLPQVPPAASLERTAAPDGNQPLKQKLDCALHLARSVALDFNNALTSILGHSSHILSHLEPDNPWRASLHQIEKSASKAAEIAQDLGTFSRQEKEVREQAAGNLNSVLQRTVEACRQASHSSAVTWTVQPERRLFAVKFDEAKMQQAISKVLENSIQALSGGGQVTVQSRNLELTEPTQDGNARLAAGAHVCIEVSDDGCGIAAEVLPKIFEPFFTTKGAPHRGLGLAWVYGIITNHGGGVAVSSTPGAGTSVRIYLPAEKRIVSDDAVTDEELRGQETVLFVDDEDLLLTLGKTILGDYGYRVFTADTGHKALEVLAKPTERVDLVITDLVMPAMSGRELIEHIRRQSPQMPVLCTSGYVWPAGQQMESGYLQKPFTARELLLKVKQALARTSADGN